MTLPHRNLLHSLERTVVIQADQQTVFSFFTDNDRWASWWGAGSTIDPKMRRARLYPACQRH